MIDVVKLQELGHSFHGQILKEYLTEKRKSINDIKSCKTWEETQGRKIALDLIDELFSFMKEKEASAKSKTLYN